MEPTGQQKTIKTKDFIAYILKFMTAEQALEKLMGIQTDQYNKIKLGEPINPKEDDTINPLMILCCAAMDLGWDMCLEKQDDETKNIDGIAVGTSEWLNRNLAKID